MKNELSFIGTSAYNAYCAIAQNDHLQRLDLPQKHVQLFVPLSALSHSKAHAKGQCAGSHLGPSVYTDTVMSPNESNL